MKHLNSKLLFPFTLQSLLDIFIGLRVSLSGDLIRSDETSLIVLNHRTRVDWNFLWAAFLHGSVPPAHNAKMVLKEEVKAIPGLGVYVLLLKWSNLSDNCCKSSIG